MMEDAKRIREKCEQELEREKEEKLREEIDRELARELKEKTKTTGIESGRVEVMKKENG